MTTAGRDIDLLVVGELNPDVLVVDADPTPVFGQVERLVSSISLEIGSSSAIMACGAARLGLAVAFVGVVGDDAMGRFMLDSLAARGVDTTSCAVDPDCATGATVVLSRGADRAILTAMGAIDRVRAHHVPADLLARARHVHLGSTALIGPLRAGLPGLLDAAHAMGATTSFDPNWDPQERWEGTDQLLAVADVALPNLTEARRISGRDDPIEAATELARRGMAARAEGDPPVTVAVKLGAEGAIAVRAGEVVRRAAYPVAVVDTTGAGDTFDAGFIAAFLRGAALDEMLTLAVACGSLSTLGIGGTGAQPTLAEALATVRSW